MSDGHASEEAHVCGVMPGDGVVAAKDVVAADSSDQGQGRARREISQERLLSHVFHTLQVWASNGNRGLDMGMGVVLFEGKVGKGEVLDRLDVWIDQHLRPLSRRARKLHPGLLEVVVVEMGVSTRVDELLRLEPTDLGDHHRQEAVAGDIEGQADKDISATLVELAAQMLTMHKELKERMTRWQSHLICFFWVPTRDDQATARGVGLDLLDQMHDLILAVVVIGAIFAQSCTKIAPLMTVDRAKIARLPTELGALL